MNASVVFMGVAGCGKSSLGAAVAAAEGLPLVEGDDFHSPESRAKMAQGIALTDADRDGWLTRLGQAMQSHCQTPGHSQDQSQYQGQGQGQSQSQSQSQGQGQGQGQGQSQSQSQSKDHGQGQDQGQGPGGGVVLTCSALKHRYRERLRAAVPGLRFVFLDISRADAQARVAARAAHFFSASLVDSQFATLEAPTGEPGVLRVDAMAPLAQLQSQVSTWLRTGDAA